MKKLLIISTLALIPCACAMQPAPDLPPSLLSFEALGSEISVSYEPLDETAELYLAVAANVEDR